MSSDTMWRGGRALAGAAVSAAAVLVLAGCGGSEPGNAQPASPVAAKSTTVSTAPKVIDCSFNDPAVRPKQLILACADLGAVINDITWQSWGPDEAQGDGVERDKVCEPNCAEGKSVTRTVHVTLSGLVQPDNLFTELTTVDDTGKTDTWPMSRR